MTIEDVLVHYGVSIKDGSPGRGSGRYPLGSGTKTVKTKDSYAIKDKNGRTLSKINYYNYDDIENFDWTLIANVETREDQRRKGYARKLLDIAYKDAVKNGKGIYVMVKKDNLSAIYTYSNSDFSLIKPYKIGDTDYFLMAKGEKGKQKQLRNMNFG